MYCLLEHAGAASDLRPTASGYIPAVREYFQEFRTWLSYARLTSRSAWSACSNLETELVQTLTLPIKRPCVLAVYVGQGADGMGLERILVPARV